MVWLFAVMTCRFACFQDLILWKVASQCSFAFHLVLPNCSTLTQFQGVTQSFNGCVSPSAPGFTDFSRCGDILAFMKCSMIVWAATPNISFADFWSSIKKSGNYRFVGLNTTCWNLYFAVTSDWGSFYLYGTQSSYLPDSFGLGWCC